MSIAPILRPRVLVMFALALILAVSAYGFAAANTIAASNAGSGEGDISGYNSTNTTYVYSATDPAVIDSVSFNLYLGTGTATPAPSSTTVTAQFLKGTSPTFSVTGDAYTCTAGTSPKWTCTAGSVTAKVIDVTSLRVIAADK